MMSYHKFKGLVPIAAARSDVVSSQEQITAASYTHHGVCPLMFQIRSPPIFYQEEGMQEVCLYKGWPAFYRHDFCPRTVTTLWACHNVIQRDLDCLSKMSF